LSRSALAGARGEEDNLAMHVGRLPRTFVSSPGRPVATDAAVDAEAHTAASPPRTSLQLLRAVLESDAGAAGAFAALGVDAADLDEPRDRRWGARRAGRRDVLAVQRHARISARLRDHGEATAGDLLRGIAEAPATRARDRLRDLGVDRAALRAVAARLP
jgi:hypothetical protein